MKAANAIIFQTINQGFNNAINIRVTWIKCNERQDVLISQFFKVFVNLFVVLRGLSEILVLLVNPGNCILINLILRFPNSLISWCYFLH